MKKTPEEKLIGQIDRLKAKQAEDVRLMSGMIKQVEPISQSSFIKDREACSETMETVEQISQCFERRKRMLKRKGEKLSEIRTALLVVESLS